MEDHCAIPTTAIDVPSRDVMKRWNNAKLRRDHAAATASMNASVQSLTRRMRLAQAYKQHSLTQHSVFQIYFGGDPRTRQVTPKWTPPTPAPPPPLLPDPSAPVESCPDRIVVCKLVPDRRRVLVAGDDDDALTVSPCSSSRPTSGGGARLFLKRRDLLEEYNESVDVYQCRLCGRTFSSVTGYKYHARLNVCQKDRQKAREAEEGRLVNLNNRAEKLRQRQSMALLQQQQSLANPWSIMPSSAAGQSSFQSRHLFHGKFEPAKRPTPRQRTKETSIYPQVLLGLGFKVLPKGQKPVTLSAFRPRGAPRSFGRTKATSETVAQPMTLTQYEREQELAAVKAPQKQQPPKQKFVSPRDTLAKLYAQFRLEQSKQLGPMYDSVFKALGFRKPKPLSSKKPPKKRPKKKKQKRKRKVSKPKPPPPKASVQKRVVQKPARPVRLEKPLPQVVDVRVLVGEIDAGRYPSIKRVPDQKHSDFCILCKQKTRPLLWCTACPKAFHLSCIRKRYTIKNPEPGDDSLCHYCIGVLHSRRVRAQKRLEEKIGEQASRRSESSPQELLTQGVVVAGREYECVAAQACQINDLTELLQDAKVRLSNCMEISKINSVRQQMISSSESLALF